MPQCLVTGCDNKKVRGNKFKPNKITFHRFPQDRELRDKWLSVLNMEKFYPLPHSVVCSVHFRDEDIDRSSPFRVYIKKDAVPSLFLSNSNIMTKGRRGRPRKTTTDKNEINKKIEIMEKSAGPSSINLTSNSKYPSSSLKNYSSPKKSEVRSKENGTSKFSFNGMKQSGMTFPFKAVNIGFRDSTTEFPTIKVVRFDRSNNAHLEADVALSQMSKNIINQINSGSKPVLTPSKEELEQMLIDSLIKLNEKTKRLQVAEEDILKMSNKLKKVHQKNKCLVKKVANLKLIVKNLRERNYLL